MLNNLLHVYLVNSTKKKGTRLQSCIRTSKGNTTPKLKAAVFDKIHVYI